MGMCDIDEGEHESRDEDQPETGREPGAIGRGSAVGHRVCRYHSAFALAATDVDEHAFDEPRIDLCVDDAAEDPFEIGEPAVDELREDHPGCRELRRTEPRRDRGMGALFRDLGQACR